MATIKNRLTELAFSHITHSLSESDNIELKQLLKDPTNQKLFEELTDRQRIEAAVKIIQKADVPTQAGKHGSAWKKYLVASALILMLAGIAAWYVYLKFTTK